MGPRGAARLGAAFAALDGGELDEAVGLGSLQQASRVLQQRAKEEADVT